MFAIHDKVSVLDDAIDGVVIAVNGRQITIETDDGFPMNFDRDELVKIATTNYHFKGIEQAKQGKETKKRKSSKAVSNKGDVVNMVVDLHIEKLVRSKKGMSNFDILSIQLDTAKHKLEFAIRKRFHKIVFIHGVGDGVLKADLYTMLRRYEGIRFYEASYAEYGMGATEIRIFQK